MLLFLSAWLRLHVIRCLLCLQAQQHVQAGQLRSDHRLFLKTGSERERERETCFYAAGPHSSFQAVREELRSLGSKSQLLILSAGLSSMGDSPFTRPGSEFPAGSTGKKPGPQREVRETLQSPCSSGRGDRLLIRELIKPWWEIWTVRPLRIGT